MMTSLEGQPCSKPLSPLSLGNASQFPPSRLSLDQLSLVAWRLICAAVGAEGHCWTARVRSRHSAPKGSWLGHLGAACVALSLGTCSEHATLTAPLRYFDHTQAVEGLQ